MHNLHTVQMTACCMYFALRLTYVPHTISIHRYGTLCLCQIFNARLYHDIVILYSIQEDPAGEAQESPRSRRTDEGLGESFDRQSEQSDSSYNSRSALNGTSLNGYRNPVYDAVQEEEDSPTVENR